MNVTESDNNKKNPTIEEILEQESNRNNKETWAKLDKTTKIQKLANYSTVIGNEKQLGTSDIQELGKYLADALERKRLLSVKEVIYDNEIGEIVKIPCLSFTSNATKKYTLKRVEKRASTLKALGPGKSKRKSDKTDKSDKIDIVMN